MQQTYLVAFAGYDQGKWTMKQKKVNVPSDMSSEEKREKMEKILREKSHLKDLTIMLQLPLFIQKD